MSNVIQNYFETTQFDTQFDIIINKLDSIEKKISIYEDKNNELLTKLNILEDNIKSLENASSTIGKISESINLMNSNIELLKNELYTKIDKMDPSIDYYRKLNTAIRTHFPVGFYSSKAVDDLNKLNNTTINKK